MSATPPTVLIRPVLPCLPEAGDGSVTVGLVPSEGLAATVAPVVDALDLSKGARPKKPLPAPGTFSLGYDPLQGFSTQLTRDPETGRYGYLRLPNVPSTPK
jgi:hypothetical protein